ncbi:MAG: LON peptidase substrate-binding domain-containing protein [Gammaproteobacteria bacterium]|nr:LON peptidase substrate-binding domain-containing protein [Gammaproteobacteria bacterium]MDH5170913.1 LON peptidase substrate-binding domain-containing protein [Gammaproteobacteria bacterium]
MSELPLFPLSGVLMPFGRVPLQIFEQRYLDLVRDCMKTDSAFGVVWIRRGAEVAQRGAASPLLGDYGTTARIVDWDQLPNGLLGITIQGGRRFDLLATGARANGLVVGEVELRPELLPAPVEPRWQSLLDVLHSLETHPHVQRMALQLDYSDAWQVACTLVQLLPLEEALKYKLLGIDAIEVLMGELDVILNQISGED